MALGFRSCCVLALACSLVLGGCYYSPPKMVTQPGPPLPTAVAGRTVILLSPIVFLEDDTGAAGTDDLDIETEVPIGDLTTEGLRSRGFQVSPERALPSEQLAELQPVKRLLRDSGLLFQPIKRRQKVPAHLAAIKSVDLAVLVGVRSKTHKLGDAPLAASKSSSTLVLLIVDQRSHNLVWARDVFFRSAPPGVSSARNILMNGALYADRTFSGALEESLKQALSTLPESQKEEEQ